MFTVYAAPPLFAAVVAIPVAVVTWRNRDEPAAEAFLGLVAALFAWSVAYAVELGFTSIETQVLWRTVTLVIGSTLPPLWVVFSFRYAGLEDRLPPRRLWLLAAEPVGYALLMATNASHGLIWKSVVVGTGPGPALELAPLYYVHLSYLYVLVLGGMGALAWVAFDTTTIHRKQSAVLLLAASFPFVTNLASKLGLSPLTGVDLTTFGYGLAISLIALAMFRFDLLDIAPVAHRQWLDQLADGIVVADREGRVVTHNDVAEEALTPPPAVGELLAPSLPARTLPENDGETLETTVGNEHRFYDLQYTPLTDHRDEPAGALIGLREVTDRTEYEQRLEVANRVLRHNFRNAMNVVQGQASLLADELSGEQAERARIIEHRATEVIDLNEGIQQMVDTLDRQDVSSTADVAAVVEAAAEAMQREFPDVRFVVDVDHVRATVVDRKLLFTAVEHLLENAAGYNDAAEPEVHVGVRAEGGRVITRVADNGPGIPGDERAVVTEGEETPLTHGSGLGLWLVSWVAKASGGELRFDSNEPRGTVVTVDLPLATGPEDRSSMDRPMPETN